MKAATPSPADEHDGLPVALTFSDSAHAAKFVAAMHDPRRALLDQIAVAKRERDALGVRMAEEFFDRFGILENTATDYQSARSRLAALEARLNEESR